MSNTKPHTKLDRLKILSSYDSKKIKVVDLTDVLSKFPEIFSAAPFEPETKKPFDLDPNEAILPIPVYPHRKSESGGHFFSKPKIVIPKSPFSGSNLIKDPTIRGWYYIDEADLLQGPFTSLEMDNWFDQGFFFNELLIKHGDENELHRLIDLFGKVEHPPPRRIERRVSTTQAEELPTLDFLKSVSSVEKFPNPFKGRLHKSLNRMSLDEHSHSGTMSQNLWQNFVDKKVEEQPKAEPTTESKEPEKVAETQPKTQEATKPQEQAATGNISSVPTQSTQTEVKEEVSKNVQKAQEDEQLQDKKAGKAGHRKHHRKTGRKSQGEEHPQPKIEQYTEIKKHTPEKKLNKSKGKKEKEAPIESQHNDAYATEEYKSTKNKKAQKKKSEDHKEKFVEHGSHRHAHDRREKVKYYTVFEPKVENPELKDKAQDSHQSEGNQSKYYLGVKKESLQKSAAPNFESKHEKTVENV